jgi:hypothetical protein
MQPLKEETPRTWGLGLLGGLPGDLKEIEHEFGILNSLEEQEKACSTKISKLWASIQDIARDTIPLPTTLIKAQYPKAESAVLVSDGTVVLSQDGETISARLQDFSPHVVEEIVRLGSALLLSHLRAKVRETSAELSAMEKVFGEELLTKDDALERISVVDAKISGIHVAQAADSQKPLDTPKPVEKQTGTPQIQNADSPVKGNQFGRYSFKASFGATEAETESKLEGPELPKIDIKEAVNAVASR